MRVYTTSETVARAFRGRGHEVDHLNWEHDVRYDLAIIRTPVPDLNALRDRPDWLNYNNTWTVTINMALGRAERVCLEHHPDLLSDYMSDRLPAFKSQAVPAWWYLNAGDVKTQLALWNLPPLPSPPAARYVPGGYLGNWAQVWRPGGWGAPHGLAWSMAEAWG